MWVKIHATDGVDRDEKEVISVAEVDEQIGESIRRIRKDKRIGQMELAKLSGVSQGGISAIELGKREAYPSTLDRLAEALGVPVAAFFERGAAPKVPPPPKTPIADSTPEALETRLYGRPVGEADGPLRPVLSESEAMELSDAARMEQDALEDWIRRYAHAPSDEKFKRRADHERVRELLKRARFYHNWLFNVWSKLFDPRQSPFQGAEQFARETDEAVADFVADLQNAAERERIERSGAAG
jgi:transcriptional regulator with XRE-family HTH domain